MMDQDTVQSPEAKVQSLRTDPGPQTTDHRTELTADQAAVLSAALDRGMVCYDLKLVEVLLLLILKRETYGCRRLVAPVRLTAWARELGMRPDKLQRLYFEELQRLLILDVNAGQGTYQLRPEMKFWSVARGRRVRDLEKQAGADPELPLETDGLLEDALSQTATESVLRGTEVPGSALAGQERNGPRGACDWDGLRRSLDRPENFAASAAADLSAGAVENFAAGAAEKSAAMEVPRKPPLGGAADKSAELFTGPLKLSLAQALKAKAKLSYRTADKSATPEQALAWLRQVDSGRQLGQPAVLAQWQALCESDPRYVLQTLRGRLEDRVKNSTEGPLAKPLGWLATVALDARKISRLARRGQ